MHFVSCRHSTSGRADLRNLATVSMRRRTELIFHVVREKRMRAVYYHGSRWRRAVVHRRSFVGQRRICAVPTMHPNLDETGGHAEPVITVRAQLRSSSGAHSRDPVALPTVL